MFVSERMCWLGGYIEYFLHMVHQDGACVCNLTYGSSVQNMQL